MSRCFPFPPPGYEKKPTTDNIDLLKKEKHKEKKHKKDKKGKEKRESKEKWDDKSEGKRSEKKDRKEKHRDKKKDKENGKEKEKDKRSISGGHFDGYSGEKLYQKDEHGRDKSNSSGARKSFPQFQNGEYDKQLHKKESFSKEKSSYSDDNKSSLQFCGQNEESLVQNKIKGKDTANSKFVQGLGRRIRDEEKGTGSHRFVVETRKKSVNRIEIRKMDKQRVMDEAHFGRNTMFQNYTPPPSDKRIDRKIEQKEKRQEKEGNIKPDWDKQREEKEKDGEKEKEETANERCECKRAERDKNKHIKKSDVIASASHLHLPNNSIQGVGSHGIFKKRKDTEANGFSHENQPRPNKMARPTSNILTENGRKQDFLQNLGTSLSGKQGTVPNSFKVDSKEGRDNGVIASQQVSKNLFIPSANHTPSKQIPMKSAPVITNHFAALIPSTKPPPPSPNHNVTLLQPQLASSAKPPVTAANPDPVHSSPVALGATQPLPIPKKKQFPSTARASMKPPHPDTKYLNQILTVPKLEHWSGYDDQEWLFSSKYDICFKKTTMEHSLQDKEEVQVWFEAMHIESVDVCALPYVIPY